MIHLTPPLLRMSLLRINLVELTAFQATMFWPHYCSPRRRLLSNYKSYPTLEQLIFPYLRLLLCGYYPLLWMVCCKSNLFNSVQRNVSVMCALIHYRHMMHSWAVRYHTYIRCSTPVRCSVLHQWLLRITPYKSLFQKNYPPFAILT